MKIARHQSGLPQFVAGTPHTLPWAEMMKTPLPVPLPIAAQRGEGEGFLIAKSAKADIAAVLADGHHYRQCLGRGGSADALGLWRDKTRPYQTAFGINVSSARTSDGAATIRTIPTEPGFTLVELLTVIAIVGILAALVVPALKNVGNGNANVSATRQLLDDVGRARQLAISQHTTVYMVFVPTNFWDINLNPINGLNNTWFNNLTFAQQTAATNLCDKQMTGYTFMADGAVGDQPGQHVWHYLAPWQNLPAGAFIAAWKFNSPVQPFQFTDPITPSKYFQINPFDYTNNFPFPTADSTNGVSLPYIAFNYLGQLTLGNDQDFSGSGKDIPLARGSVAAALDPGTRMFQLNSPQVTETPPGNSTNIYNIVHIDWLTGRAQVEQPKVQ